MGLVPGVVPAVEWKRGCPPPGRSQLTLELEAERGLLVWDRQERKLTACYREQRSEKQDMET